MSVSPGLMAYKLAYELSPIILTGGVARFIPGGMLPIIAITEGINFATGLLSSGNDDISLDTFFANFRPLPGAKVINNEVGTYPFANQTVAANAIIQQPLGVSMLMHCPARKQGGYASKMAIMLALQATLQEHNQSGGTYTVATPSYFYTNCLLVGMEDVSAGGSKQVQSDWRMDFTQPLLSLDQAQQVENNLMSKITSGTAIDGAPSWSGLAQAVGLPPSLTTSSIVPAASGAAGAGVAGSQRVLGS